MMQSKQMFKKKHLFYLYNYLYPFLLCSGANIIAYLRAERASELAFLFSHLALILVHVPYHKRAFFLVSSGGVSFKKANNV